MIFSRSFHALRNPIAASLLVLAMVAFGSSCSSRQSTGIVLRIDSNIGPALRIVHVQLDRGDGTDARVYEQRDTSTLPGSIAVYPRDAANPGRLRAIVTADTGDVSTTFSVTIGAAFVVGRIVQVDVYLAAACQDAALRAMCTATESCGPPSAASARWCVPNERPGTDFMPDAARLDVPRQAPADARIDSTGSDAADVMVAMDSGIDVTADVPLDMPIDVPADVPTDVPVPYDGPTMLPAPRLRSPMSTSTVSLTRPTLEWFAAAGGSATVEVEVCRNRAMNSMCQRFRSSSTTGQPVTPLTPGMWFWRAASVCGPVACQNYSAVWELRALAAHGATVDTSYGTALDLNGDGAEELAIGAPDYFNPGAGSLYGMAYVYRSAVSTMRTPLAGTVADVHAGASMSSAGDVNGDGFGDFVVGATGAVGYLQVYFGAAGWGTSTPAVGQHFPAPSGAAGFGAAVAGVGDFDHDGYGDVMVGAPNQASGVVYVYRGSMSGLLPMSTSIASPLGTRFGAAIAGAGDLNADGFADTIITSPTANTNGTVYVYGGSAAGPVLTSASVAGTASPVSVQFGAALGGGGDIDGDGRADIAVGAPGTAASSGQVVIYRGSAAYLDVTPAHIVGFPTSMTLGGGASVSIAGDINGDGRADLVTGTPRFAQAYQRGGITIALTQPSFPTTFQRGITSAAMADIAFGTSVLIGDFDGDGHGDVAAGDPVVTGANIGVAVFMTSATGVVPAAAMYLNTTLNDLFGQTLAWSAPARARERRESFSRAREPLSPWFGDCCAL